MNKVILRKTPRDRRKVSVRKSVFGTTERPRLSVYRSNKYISAQIINDELGKTLVSFEQKAETYKGKTKTEAAFEVGKEIAKKAKDAKVTKVVFDRNGYNYHGRVKSLAEGAREGGLEF